MKSVVKAILILSVAVICAGFAYGYHQAHQEQIITKSHTIVERVHSGDTVDTILMQYFNSYNEGGISFGEFKYSTLHLPENKHLLDKNGGLKLLQVGDKITIVMNVKVKVPK